MKQFWLQVVLLVVVIFGGLYITRNQSSLNTLLGVVGMNTSERSVAETRKLRIVDENLSVKGEVDIEVADTQESRAKGLGGRDKLASQAGMLFILDNRSIPTFWMKGMRIRLDFIWIDGDRVVDLLPNVPPPETGQSDDTLPKYAPVREIDKVLEVNSGYIRSHNISVGDRVEFVELPLENQPLL